MAEIEEKNPIKKNLIILIINSVLGIALIVGTAVYCSMTHDFAWWMQVLAYGIAVVCLLCPPICMLIKKESGLKESAFKLAFVIMICAVVFVPMVMIFKTVLHLDTAEDIKAFIESTGAWSMVIFILLQVLQVVILPLPAAICYGAGTLLYDAWLATLLASIGVIIGSLICFFLGRVYGFKVVSWIAGKEQTIKYSQMFGRRGKVLFIMMQVLPFFPDDILCLVAGLTSMNFWFFLCVMVIIRPLVIAVYCFGFEKIPFDQPWGIAVWVTIIVVCVVLGILSYKYQDKIELWLKKKFGGKPKLLEEHGDTVPPKGDYMVQDDPSVAPKKDDAVLSELSPDPTVSPPIDKNTGFGDQPPSAAVKNTPKDES